MKKDKLMKKNFDFKYFENKYINKNYKNKSNLIKDIVKYIDFVINPINFDFFNRRTEIIYYLYDFDSEFFLIKIKTFNGTHIDFEILDFMKFFKKNDFLIFLKYIKYIFKKNINTKNIGRKFSYIFDQEKKNRKSDIELLNHLKNELNKLF